MRRAEYELVLADAKDAKELWSKLQWDEEKQRGAVNTTVPEGGDEFNCQQLQAGWRLLGHNMESLCKELQFDPDNKDKARARTRKRTRVCVCVCHPLSQEFSQSRAQQAHRGYLCQRSCSAMGDAEIDHLRVPAELFTRCDSTFPLFDSMVLA